MYNFTNLHFKIQSLTTPQCGLCPLFDDLTCVLHKLQSVRIGCAGCSVWTASVELTCKEFLSSADLQPFLFEQQQTVMWVYIGISH